MNLKYTSLHIIDHHTETADNVEIANQSQELKQYVIRLMEEITKNNSHKKFDFRSDNTEVRNAINFFLNGKESEAAEINALRLLDVELKAQDKIKHLNRDIQKGSLFQAVFSTEEETLVIISKADHNKFLDEIDFSLKNGLPWEKRVFKAFLVRIDNQNTPTEIYVFDTTKKIARYWWDAYLELEETYTDKYNTETSMDILDKKIFNTLKVKHPADHTILRNATIGYFRSEDSFDLNHYLDSVFRNYISVSDDLPLDGLIQKIEELPARWKFDSQFEIQKDCITKRQVNKVHLTPKIELVLKDHIPNLSEIITTVKDAEGKKFIQIQSEEGYERFKTNNQ